MVSDFHQPRIWMAIDAAEEHCHGPAGAEGASGHFLWLEADRSANVADAVPDCFCDVLTFEDVPFCSVMVACNWNMCGGALTL